MNVYVICQVDFTQYNIIIYQLYNIVTVKVPHTPYNYVCSSVRFRLLLALYADKSHSPKS